jgi:hypothetical protein
LTIGWNWFLAIELSCFPVIFLTCPKNLFVFVSVFVKLLMPVCGVLNFASVLYSVFVLEWNLLVVMSGLSHWKYDFRHVHCSSWLFCMFPLFSSSGYMWANVNCRHVVWNGPMTVVSCNKYLVLLFDFWWSGCIELNCHLLSLWRGILSFLSGYLRWGCRIKFYYFNWAYAMFLPIVALSYLMCRLNVQ